MKTLSVSLTTVFALAGIALSGPSKPNILVILADDLGFSDLGCYGSEIETPSLDRLAAGGLRFTQFYNTAKCHSSRVSLLTGRWCRQAGDIGLHRAVTIPEMLVPAGYFTAMTGKWHLSKEPTDFGFQRYFGHLSGACNYFRGDQTFRLNHEPWPVPDEGFYTTVANVDFGLEFLAEARQAKKPWFLYVAFNAPHAPLQPLEEDYRKYLGRYGAGWDRIREARIAKQKSLDLFGGDIAPSPRPDHIPAWDALIPEIRAWEARRMAALAGMIDRLDREIGRLVADLERAGELDNTLILFFSDNGACPYDRRSDGMDREPWDPDSSWSDSTGWAWARNSPFRYYKQNQFEGGVATPAIAHWPAGIRAPAGATVHAPAHLVDILPTLAGIAGAEIPASWPGRELTPLAGVSLEPVFRTGTMPARPPIHFLFASDRGLRDGDWKLVSFRSQAWELYDLSSDRTERINLAGQHPEVVERLSRQWHEMASKVLMAPEKECKPVAEAAPGRAHPEWSVYTGEHSAVTSSRGPGQAKGKSKLSSGSIRARRNTKMAIENDTIVLTCEDGDPGIALDRIGALSPRGPYRMRFRIQSDASGPGEVFFTTDEKTKLPAGQRVEFDVAHDGAWHEVTLELGTEKPIHALRLDPGDGAGSVRIEGLSLETADGTALRRWP